MITGRQIRDARAMLGWTDETFCTRANVGRDVLTAAEAVDGLPGIGAQQVARIQQALERGGIRFGRNGAVMLDRSRHGP